MQRHISSIAHAAYHDLLRSLKDEAISEIRGTPTRVERNGKAYWYDTYRVGSEVRKAYIGEDTAERRARIERLNEIAAAAAERRSNRARLIRILRGEGFLGIDAATGSLLNALQKAGVFRLGGTIVGTQAFRLYEGELGIRYSVDQAAQTNDIDIASFERLSLALEDIVSEPLQRVFADFAFEAVPSLERGKVWRWKQSRNELLVEFLTPSFEAAEELKPLAALDVHAQSLHYLNYLIASPIQAAVTYRNGVLVQVPRPERFAVHKLIVADRRREGPNGVKAHKDRMQAAFLIDVLAEDRPTDLIEAYEDAISQGARWRERIAASLKRMPDTRARLVEAGVGL
ncbi:nucleotidyltransferase family protein [Ancylobacter mangrovi]|uniref:nucleotidyltransferase family protein n=1 Tax=Ancylobacter mangrovi TaxID=2972472 RepID=UPI0021636D85|nr:GSU2403 family nucleotidyltransferase fold protein [Ancylobacter mangrovi]MCS0502449.1 GSU2403 family nucleotidyltransferase fold protein [Ancylobacter mangrovi]